MRLLLPLLLLPFGTAVADPDTMLGEETDRWPAVAATLAAAERGAGIAGVWHSGHGSTLYLAPDGRAAATQQIPEGPRAAMSGLYQQLDGVLTLEFTATALDPASLTEAYVAQLREWIEANQDEADGDPAMPTEAVALEPATELATDTDAAQRLVRHRLMVVRIDGGEMLVVRETALHAAARWDGNGPLTLYAHYWRGLDLAAGEEQGRFDIADPLAQPLPSELSRALRREPLVAHAVERLQDEVSLEWRAHEAQVQYRIDKGALHGVFEGMQLLGAWPHEQLHLTVTEVAADHALAATRIERFHPDQRVELPPAQLTLVSRRGAAASCPLDTSAAVRASVRAVHADDAPDFDADGFAFVRLSIDQGAAHGLLLGDRFSREEDWTGEGRVVALDREQADVLWRLRRYEYLPEPTTPQVGDALVTPAWQRDAWYREAQADAAAAAVTDVDAAD